jgi:hypothetical protein
MNTTHDDVAPADLHPGEKAYPIYRITAHWSQATLPGAERRIHYVGKPPLPEGHSWNGTSWSKMEREERDPEAIKAELTEQWWPQYAEKNHLPEPADLEIGVTLARRDVWCNGWFSHWTFDVGLSDEEVLASFERYVDRILYSSRSEDEIGGLLMGAEDRWRWCGSVDGVRASRKTPPPCRCPECKKLGIVRIDH